MCEVSAFLFQFYHSPQFLVINIMSAQLKRVPTDKAADAKAVPAAVPADKKLQKKEAEKAKKAEKQAAKDMKKKKDDGKKKGDAPASTLPPFWGLSRLDAVNFKILEQFLTRCISWLRSKNCPPPSFSTSRLITPSSTRNGRYFSQSWIRERVAWASEGMPLRRSTSFSPLFSFGLLSIVHWA